MRQLALIEVGLVLEQFKQVQCALFFRSHVCLEKGMAPPSALHRCLRIGVPDGNETEVNDLRLLSREFRAPHTSFPQRGLSALLKIRDFAKSETHVQSLNIL